MVGTLFLLNFASLFRMNVDGVRRLGAFYGQARVDKFLQRVKPRYTIGAGVAAIALAAASAVATVLRIQVPMSTPTIALAGLLGGFQVVGAVMMHISWGKRRSMVSSTRRGVAEQGRRNRSAIAVGACGAFTILALVLLMLVAPG